jgi:HAMP domain-containing protein
VATAIATGDLTQKITVDVQGEILQIKDVINTMVDQLNSFAGEVTRVAREVGPRQARRPGAGARRRGTWKDLTDNVNAMAGNLTGQVRNIAEVTTAVALGDLPRRSPWTCAARSWSSRTPSTPWWTSSTLRLRGDARGARGGHRGQARRPGAGARGRGTWKDLTDNVNSMASNLTGQVRNIAEVTTAVARGDLSKKITWT